MHRYQADRKFPVRDLMQSDLVFKLGSRAMCNKISAPGSLVSGMAVKHAVPS